MRLNYIDNVDCLDGLREIPDKSVDLVVTDPPYMIETRGAGLYKQPDKKYITELQPMADGFSDVVLDELCRVLKKINIYLFCSQRQIMPLLDYFVKRRGCNWNLLTWHKTNPVPACGNKYLTDTEYILFFREKGVRVYGEFCTKRTWYATPLNQSDKKKYGHPTVKPLEIIENVVTNSAEPGAVVLDPFMGSGTTAVACIRTGRNYVGFEIDPAYHAIAMERIQAEVDNKEGATL